MKRRSLSSVNLFSFFLLIDYFVSVIPELHECFKVFLSSYQQSHWIVLFATNNKSEIEISTDLSHVTPFVEFVFVALDALGILQCKVSVSRLKKVLKVE